MPKTRINCPNCRQPITADIEQLFDAGADPSAKQRLLSGSFNIAQCPNCGYQGSLATPIVYHDPEKELLLTFLPPEVGLARDDQQRLIGQLINQVVNHLPQEKRKGYLLRPQETLTLQGLIERVLEGEGVTREMIQAQQQRLNLIQRLMGITDQEVLQEIARQEDKMIDAEFFALLRRLIEAAMMGGDQGSAQRLMTLQQSVLPVTTFGRELQAQSQELETAVQELRSAGNELDRDFLLDLVEKAPTETRVRAYVSLVRPLFDYEFFQRLSERMENAADDHRARLEKTRQNLLEWTRQVDQQLEQRAQATRELINEVIDSDNVQEAMMEALPAVDEFFLNELNAVQEAARSAGDLDRLGKIQKMIEVLQQASAPPPEVALIEDLLEAEDDEARRALLEEHKDEITPEFLSSLASIASQVEGGEDQELAGRVKALNRMVVRFSMEQNFK
jgi:hypothetical protein